MLHVALVAKHVEVVRLRLRLRLRGHQPERERESGDDEAMGGSGPSTGVEVARRTEADANGGSVFGGRRELSRLHLLP